MSDTQISQDTQNLISASTKEEVNNIENNKKLREEYEERIKKVREEGLNAVRDNSNLSLQKVDLEDQLRKERAEKEALRNALFHQKNSSLLTENERQESQAERVSRLTYETILNKCKSGYFRGGACKECSPKLEGLNTNKFNYSYSQFIK
jgi:hypothetical protein